MIATHVTLIHELAKFGDFLLFSEIFGLARGLEVCDTFSLSKHMHCPLVEEELSVLLLHLVNVWYVPNQIPTVISITILLNLLRCVSTFSELITGQFQHFFHGCIHGLLKLLESENCSIIEICFNASPLRHNCDSEAALDNTLVVVFTHGQDFG